MAVAVHGEAAAGLGRAMALLGEAVDGVGRATALLRGHSAAGQRLLIQDEQSAPAVRKP